MATASKANWADWGLLAVVALCQGQCLRGQKPFPWFCIPFVLITVRLAISVTYRARESNWLREQWSRLEAFAATSTGRIPWLAAFTFAALPAIALYLYDDRTLTAVDTQGLLPFAASLVTEGDGDLDEFYAAEQPPRCCRRVRGHLYPSWPVGMTQVALPVAALARLVGADLHDSKVHQRLEKWTAAWLAGFCVALFFLLALHLSPPRPALALTLLMASGSALYSAVGMTLWHQSGVGVGSLGVLLLEFRQLGRSSWFATTIQGVLCGSMLPCRLSAVLFIGAFTVWVLLRAPRRALAVAALTAVVYAPWWTLYRSIGGSYGSPVPVDAPANAFFATEVLLPLLGVLASPARGLLVYQPWLLLGGAVLLPAVRRQMTASDSGHAPVGWAWLCAAVVLLQIGLVASWKGWWGGHSWGSRLLTEIVPLLGLLCVRPFAALWQQRAGWMVLGPVAALSFWMHFCAAHFGADAWNAAHNPDCLATNRHSLWTWSDHPFLYPLLRQPASRP